MDIQSNLDNLIFANLLFVTIVCWASLVFPKFKFLSKLGFYGNCCASSCLFILLGSRWLISGYFPLSNLYESLMFLAWGITSLGVIIEDRSKVSIIGSISTKNSAKHKPGKTSVTTGVKIDGKKDAVIFLLLLL